MRINKVSIYDTQTVQDRRNKFNTYITLMGAQTLENFGTNWFDKLPATFKSFYKSLKDKNKYTPL